MVEFVFVTCLLFTIFHCRLSHEGLESNANQEGLESNANQEGLESNASHFNSMLQGNRSTYDWNCTKAEVWRGYDKVEELNTSNVKTVEIALSYCKTKNLSWIEDMVYAELPVESSIKLTILSKCGREKNIPDLSRYGNRHIEVDIIPLNNVGGCDYAYAYFMNRYVKKTKAEVLNGSMDPSSTIIFFLKESARIDPNNQHGEFGLIYRPIQEMFKIAHKDGFACGLKSAICAYSPYFEAKVMRNYTMKSYVRATERRKQKQEQREQEEQHPKIDPNFNLYGYTNLGEFHDRMLHWTFPQKIARGCYGGSFAIAASQLFRPSILNIGVLRRILIATGRYVTTIEEHFIERTWASLLGRQLTENETDVIENCQIKDADCPLLQEGRICSSLNSSTFCCMNNSALSNCISCTFHSYHGEG